MLPLHTPTGTGCSCNDLACRSVGKHPRTRNGKDDATTDLEQVGSWWEIWPDANIGLWCETGFRSAQLFFEERDGPGPRQFGRFLVVARRLR